MFLVLALLAMPLAGVAQGQYGPVLDPAFQSPTLRRYGTGSGALQLSDGTRVVAGSRPAAPTSVYPVPSHHELHLRLSAAGRPRQVQLVNALGRTVLTQAVGSAPDFSLKVSELPRGIYLLRVDYALSGAVTRRVVLE